MEITEKVCHVCKKSEGVKNFQLYHFGSGGSYALKGQFLPFHPQCHKVWHESTIANLANLDEIMDYCEYFKREKGQVGNYVREGKSCPVRGDFDGYHLNCPHKDKKGFVCCAMQDFRKFLEDNNWLSDWFLIKNKYSKYV